MDKSRERYTRAAERTVDACGSFIRGEDVAYGPWRSVTYSGGSRALLCHETPIALYLLRTDKYVLRKSAIGQTVAGVRFGDKWFNLILEDHEFSKEYDRLEFLRRLLEG